MLAGGCEVSRVGMTGGIYGMIGYRPCRSGNRAAQLQRIPAFWLRSRPSTLLILP